MFQVITRGVVFAETGVLATDSYIFATEISSGNSFTNGWQLQISANRISKTL